MNKYKLIISYDGTNYSGWQIQPNAPTIQETIQENLSLILQENIILIGAGRTDAGVHAKGQVAHFSSSKNFSLSRLLYSLNSLLPLDIRILDICNVPSSFHARYSAIKKTYVYTIYQGKIADPFSSRYTLWISKDIDISLLKKGAACFVGSHNFSAFANEAHIGCAKNKPVKTLFRIEVTQNNPLIHITFEGNGFLYKMVRNIVGTLLRLLDQKISLESIPELIRLQDRRKTPAPAPAHGLTLFSIEYPMLEKSMERRK
ncbi:MAG: tRNA pseudouridine(38-40) synthase TruA [Parachlamydiales bacterium]|nr:tRNA pseudouridine(38-40) synthase TruA [Parachlamydiales bacterium]